MTGLRTASDASGNAESQAQSTAEGSNTQGIVNRHPANDPADAGSESSSSARPFLVGVSEDRNKRWRRTMEDSHAFVYDYGGVYGQGFFSIFDGHAGKSAAEWCGQHFHECLSDVLMDSGGKTPIPDLLNTTFHKVDAELSQLASAEGSSSGCTAVTCLLRLEDQEGNPAAHAQTGGIRPSSSKGSSATGGAAASQSGDMDDASPPQQTSTDAAGADTAASISADTSGMTSSGGILSSFAQRIRQSSSGSQVDAEGKKSRRASASSSKASGSASSTRASKSDAPAASEGDDGLTRVEKGNIRRVLYTANAGDARAVLCRKGQAVRLTYDHKASDAQEAKRIMDAGGFVMNNRVNAVLAVTRSLGDQAMKEFVVGAPYTTETTLNEDDAFLIVACDGLWDVVEDQDAVDLVADVKDPIEASDRLLQHALSNFSTDNTSVMVIRFNY